MQAYNGSAAAECVRSLAQNFVPACLPATDAAQHQYDEKLDRLTCSDA